MIRTSLVATLLSLAPFATAIAQVTVPTCSCGGGTSLAASAINTLLGGNTVCAAVGSDQWQEWHSGSNVVEVGNNPPDGEVVGVWSTSGTDETDSLVTYAYGSGGSGGTYNYEVCQEGSAVHFCGATNVTNASVVAGKGCP